MRYKETKKATMYSILFNKIPGFIVFKGKQFKLMQTSKGEIAETDSFEIGGLFNKNIVKLTTIPDRTATAQNILEFVPRTVFYMEV